MNVGEQVPDFKATLDSGEVTSLSAIVEDGPAVFFFYPKAFTSGCTAQACHFRDLAAEFSEAGAARYGISRDDVETQSRFSQEHGFDYPLIADVSGDIAKAFGAKRPGNLWSKRRTYVVGPGRRFIGEVKSETDMDVHADEALEMLGNA